MHYTIVVPAHNEASNLEASLTCFIQNLPVELASILKEIIVVENGSTDDTLQVCRRLECHFPDLIRVASIQRGSYGEAIKLGMLQSKGTHLSVLECDFLDPTFVVRSIAMFKAGKADVIVGSKRHRDSRDRRPLKRRALTLLYNLIFLRLFFGYPGTDTHGLKSIEADCAKKLCLTALTTDEVFQTEIVLLGWRLGFRVDEIPVEISELRPSPVKVLRRVPKVLNIVWELKRSLGRFPTPSSRLDLATVSATNSAVAGDIQQTRS
jgi:glycosyltransferase involved in cell wall biosynthesis